MDILSYNDIFLYPQNISHSHTWNLHPTCTLTSSSILPWVHFHYQNILPWSYLIWMMDNLCMFHYLLLMISCLRPFHILHIMACVLLLSNPLMHSHCIVCHYQPLLHIFGSAHYMFLLFPVIWSLSPHNAVSIFLYFTMLSAEHDSFSCFDKFHGISNLISN